MKILVTGGFGFIGSHLVSDLLTRGDEVHVVDDLSSSPVDHEWFVGTFPQTQSARLSHDISSVNEFVQERWASDVRYDAIFHLASPVGPAGVLQYAGEMVREIVRDTYLLMDRCVSDRSRFVDVSTSEVYGGGQSGLCSEDTEKRIQSNTTVRLEYAVAKLAAETAIINKVEAAGLDATIIRPFNVAGPRQSPVGGFVLPRFIRQAHLGRALTVFGDGSALRAFTHVKDLVDGLLLVGEAGRRGVAYNIGNPANKVSILELARLVVEVTGSTSEIVHVDPTTVYGPMYAEANDKFPEPGRAMGELGWSPHRSVRQTVIDAYDDFLDRLRAGAVKDDLEAI